MRRVNLSIQHRTANELGNFWIVLQFVIKSKRKKIQYTVIYKFMKNEKLSANFKNVKMCGSLNDIFFIKLKLSKASTYPIVLW
jgi:hypothetical protein